MKRSPWRRVVLSVGAGLGCLAFVLLATGLLTGRPTGAGDNGDGWRLYCGAGLSAATPDAHANWQGGVVVDFNRVAVCKDPMPSTSLAFLRVAAYHSGDTWSLTRLGYLYAAVAAAIVTVAAWATMARRTVGMLILAPAVLALAHPHFSRFFVSTFSEPTGLIGAFAVVCGVGVLTITGRANLVERLIGLVLVASGSMVAALAKVGYAPFAVGVLICLMTAVSIRRDHEGWRSRLIGPAFAVAMVLIVFAPLRTAMDWQTRHYEVVNAHNLTYTAVLTQVPGSEVELGLPPEAADAAGTAYYPNGSEGVPGGDVIAASPAEVRSNAMRILAKHPGAVIRSLGIALQATKGSSLSYLPSSRWEPDTVPPVIGTSFGAQGANARQLDTWLDGMSFPWWPSVLTVIGLIAGAMGFIRREPLWSAFARMAGVCALSSLGLALVTVLGDGFFEIAKHVWLAAYLLEVTLFALIGAAISAGVETLRRTRANRGQLEGSAIAFRR